MDRTSSAGQKTASAAEQPGVATRILSAVLIGNQLRKIGQDTLTSGDTLGGLLKWHLSLRPNQRRLDSQLELGPYGAALDVHPQGGSGIAVKSPTIRALSQLIGNREFRTRAGVRAELRGDTAEAGIEQRTAPPRKP